MDTGNERYIKLDDVGLECNEMAESGVSRTQVIGCETCPTIAQVTQSVVKSRVILDRDVLGQLDDNPRTEVGVAKFLFLEIKDRVG
jgi:hypothetical protein